MRHLRDFGLTIFVLALMGVAAGFLWSALAPRTPYIITKGGPELTDPTTQSLIGADGWFAVVTGVAGLACGVVAYLIARKGGRPIALLAGLAVGGLLAGFLALSVGTSLGGSMVQAAAPRSSGIGSTVDVLGVTARGVLLSWALVAVAIFGILEAVDGRDTPEPAPAAGTGTGEEPGQSP